MAGYSQQVKLQFMADTSQPQKQLQQLATQLKQISDLQFESTGINKGVQEAVKSAETLQKVLQKAVNVDTGKLNMGTLTAELNKSGTTISQLSVGLLKLGPAGAQSFRTLASSVAQAEMPIKKMNATLQSMLTSLTNTVKWQISSSAVHGLMSGFSGAVGYVKDLNRSLNDIRIVTGQSVDDMARFAEQANKAAKALSTTTKAYADASLIYYQQGDSQEMAAKKAAITIKAANASFGSSTKEMSEYLTAVWNSYQVGADELEHYVDIMAALGAKTATSLEEIATSMQKVAATANTVGVSMEQVSSIISTVSSVTRESAESIGTSYKTIFARMGDLKLGGTDDGVGLGQVSSQLKSIGVEILTTSGELRDMGDIITDLGNKWQTMSNAQKAATAQAVAGKRQYTQLMALFENWDMYNKNLNIAQNAEGELQHMADVYAESWAAAADKVRASWESVWSSLLNDEAIIKFMNGLADFVQGIESAIEGLGGLEGVLWNIGTVITTVFSKNLTSSIDNMLIKISTFKNSFANMTFADGLKSFFTESTFQRQQRNDLNDLQKENIQYMTEGRKANKNFGYTSEGIQTRQTSQLIAAKERLLDISSQLSKKDQLSAQEAVNGIEKQILKTEQLAQERQEAMNLLNQSRTDMIAGYNSQGINARYTNSNGQIVYNSEVMQSMSQQANSQFYGVAPNVGAFASHYRDLALNADVASEAMRRMKTIIQDYGNVLMSTTPKTDQLEQAIREVDIVVDTLVSGQAEGLIKGVDQDIAEIQRLRDALKGLQPGSQEYINTAGSLTSKIRGLATSTNKRASLAGRELQTELNIDTSRMTEGINQASQAMFKFGAQTQRAQIYIRDTNGQLIQLGKQSVAWGQKASAILTMVSSIGSVMTTASALIKNESDSIVSTVSSSISMISSIAMSAIMAFNVSNPLGWISLAVSGIATVIGLILGDAEKKREEFQKKEKASLEQFEKDINKDTEEQKNKQSLMKTYNDLYETYLRTGEGQDELKASAYELASAYGLLGANLLIAQGNFQAFNNELIKSNQYGTRIAANNTTITEKKRELGSTDKNSVYRLTNDESNTGVSASSMIRQKGIQVLPTTMGYYEAEGLLTRREVAFDGIPGQYIFDWDAIQKRLLSYAQGNDKYAKQLFFNFFSEAFKGSATEWTRESIQDMDWQDIFNAVDTEYNEWTGSSIFTRGEVNAYSWYSAVRHKDLSPYFTTNKNGNYVLKWNDLQTGEERYNQYKMYEQAVAEGGEIDAYRDSISAQMDTILKTVYNGNTEAALLDPTYKALQEELTNVNKLINSINGLLTDKEISQQVNLIDDLSTLNSQLQLEQSQLQNFLGKNEENSTFSEFTKNYSLMQQSIDNAMKDNATAYASLTEFMIEDSENPGKWKIDPNKRKEYEAARNALTESFIDTYTGFDDYMLMFQDIVATFDTTEITFNGKETTVRQRVIDFISQAGIKTIEQFSAELLHAIEFIASSGNYDFENNALIKSVMASDAQRIKYNEASNKYTNFSNTAKTFKEDMDLAEAEAFYNAVDWGQDGIISWEEFLEKDYDDRLAYIESISDNYLETVKKEAETLKTTQEATLAQWEAVMNDAKYSKFKGTMGDYVDSSGQYDAVAIRKGFDTYIAGRGYTYNAEKGLYVSSTNANDTKTEQAFWNEYVATDADLAASGISLEALKGYISALEGASGSFVLIQQADGTIAALQLVGDQAESTATAFNRLAKSLSQLPTEQDDLQKIADVLSGGSIAALMNMTAEERAAAWASSLSTPVLHQSGVVEGQLPDKRGIRRVTVDEGETFSTNEDYIAYLEDWDNYNTAMSAILSAQSAIPLNNIENITSALDTLTESYEEFITTGKMSDKTKNALQMAGIDPNSIQSIDDYRNAIRRLETDQTTQAESLKTIMTQYGDGLIDWSKMGKDVTWEKFLTSQDDNIQVILEKFPKLAEYYEQWRQAAIEADDAGVNLDAIEAQIQLSQAAAASAAELERLKTAAEEAKTAVDQLNSAIGQTEPLSIEALTRLNQQGINGANWDGTGAGALSIYGKALSNSTMKQIEVLQHQMAGAQIAEGSNLWKAGTHLVQSQNLASMTSDELTTMLSHTGLSAPVITEIQRMVEAAKAAGEELTWADILEGLQEYDGDLAEQMDVIWAQFEDSGVKAVQAILQAEQTVAQQTVQIWKTACQAILAAKQGIAEGKSIGESLMGSDGQMAAIIAIALGQGMTPEAIKTMLSGGDSQAWQNVVNAGPDFNAATYATAQGGQTQFLYNNNGVMAGDASELYTNASDALGDHWENFLSQLTEVELAAYNAAKDKAQTDGVAFDGKQWLLDYLFPGWKNDDGTFTSKATDDYNRSRGTVLEGEWTAEMEQARTELDDARTIFNRTYEEETANINDWKAIHDAAVTSQQTGQSIYDILGKDQAAGIMARLGLTKEQLNAQTVETATAAINASVANINAAKVTFNTTTDGIENIEMLGTAKADAQEEVGEQVATTTNVYGNATWVPVKPLKGNGPQAINADGEPAMTLNTTNGYNSIADSITSMAKAYNISEPAMKDYIRAVNNITDENTVLTQAHLDVATAAMRQQAGIDMATESLDGYIRTIKKGDTDSMDYIKSLEGMRNIYKELYNLSDEEVALLSDDFLTNADNMALLQRAMAGDQTAWTQLQGNYNTAHATQITAGTLKTQNGALVGDTSEGDNKAFTNQIAKIQHEAQLLEQEMEALNSIDITEMPVKGTAAYEALSEALNKAGKSMSDYSRMSSKERAQVLGDAKVAKLKEQKSKNAELIKAYEEQYNFEDAGYGWDDAVADKVTAEYQAYLDAKQRELELNQEIADTQQETQNQIYEIGAADVEARIAALEAEREKIQETVDAYAELADIMMQAAETGELTASQIQKIKATDEGLLSQWNNATTYAERVRVAAQAQARATQKAIEAITAENEGITRAETYLPMLRLSDDTLTPEKALFKTSKWASRDAFATEINNMKGLTAAAQQALLDAYDKVEARMTSNSTINQFYQAMSTELKNMSDLGADEIAELQAQLQTTISQMYSDLGAYEVQMAQQAVQVWLDAFNQIAEARKQLLMGEDIGESLTSSLESYVALAKAFKEGGGKGSLANAYRSGTLSASQLELGAAGDLAEMLFDSMGMSTDNKGFNLFTNVFGKDGKTITGKSLRDVNARATQFGMKRADFETQKAFEEAVNERTEAYIQNLLQQNGYDEITARDLTHQALYGTGTSQVNAENAIEAAAMEMHNYAQEYADLLESNTQLAEADAAYQARVKELTEQQDKAKLGAQATDAIQETEASQRTAETVAAALQQAGISEDAYIKMLQDKGFQVDSLEDIARLTDAQLESIETSLEQDALAAGNAIIQAAQIFKAIVTSKDEATLNAELDKLGAVRDKDGNIIGFEDYEGGALNYGADTAAGKQANQNVTDAQETQGQLEGEYSTNQDADWNQTKATLAAYGGFDSVEDLEAYADRMIETGEIVAKTREEQLKHAASLAKMQNGFKKAEASLKTWTKTLKEADKRSTVYTDALEGMRDMYADLFDLNAKEAKGISDAFMESAENAELLEKAMEGDEEAWDSLKAAIGKDLFADANVSAKMQGELQSLADTIAAYDFEANGIKVGASIETTPFYDAINQMTFDSYAAAQAISAGLSSMGVDAQIVKHTVWVPSESSTVDYSGYTPVYGPKGELIGYEGVESSVVTNADGYEQTYYTLEGATYNGKGVTRGGSGGGSKGGGGGGNKKPKHAKKIKLEDEIDRYHEVNQRLERMGELLDKIDKYKARAFGKGYLKNLEQESKMLKAQQAMYKRKMEEAKLYYEQDSANMASKYGATFDEYGNMSNYDEVLAGIIADENRKIDYYNSLSAAEQEKLDEQYEHDGGYITYIAKTREDFKKDLKKMEDSAATLGEATSAFEEGINKISANNLEAITYKAEYQIELNDADRKLLQFYVDRYKDDVNKQAESFEKLITQGEKLANNTEALKQKQKDLEAAYADGEITQADYAKGLQETRDALLENAEALLELEQNVKDFYGNTLEMISDAFHEQVDHITAATDAMQSYINILGLMGKGQNYSEKALFYGQRAEFAQQEAIAKKAHLDLLLGQKADYDALIASGKEMTEVEKQWYEDLLNAIDEANGEFLESVETALTYLQEKYQNAVAAISEDLDKALSGSFGSLEGLSDAYSYYTEIQGRYVSAARELYEVSKLNRDIEMSIEDATTSASKKMLKDLQDRINKQSELNQLTEYDIEMNRLQYELALAKIGLEEAQNAKDIVRLTRDESGNYIYQYTADNDKINEAQQTYEDVLQQINDLALNRVQELEQGFIETRQRYKEQYDAIVNDMNLTDEERAAKLAELNERFKADMDYYAEQMGIATENLTISNSTIMQVYSDDLRTVSMTTRDGINEDIAALIENKDQAIESFKQAVADAQAISSQHQADIDAFTSATVGDYNAMADAATKYGDDVDRAMQKAQEAVGESTDIMLDKIRDLGASWESFINGPLDDFIDGIIELAEEIQDTLHWLAELEAETATTPEPGPEPPANINPNPQEPEGDEEGKDTGDKPGGSGNSNKYFVKWYNKSGTFEGYANAQNALEGWRSSYKSSETAKIKSKYDLNTPNGGYMMQQDLNALEAWMYQNSGSITKVYKTGGLADYTGPAWLDGTKSHPELVLNATDTQNMLQAVHGLRELDTESITMLLSALGAATASLFGALTGNYHASGVTTSNTQELNQNVEIHADFPNVTDRNEIIEAIDGLVNRASQFVQKKIW